MNNVFKSVKILLIILLGLNGFFLLLAYASGHHIPMKTNLTIASVFVVLVVMLLLVNKLRDRWEDD
jgi:hypothetical protein